MRLNERRRPVRHFSCSLALFALVPAVLAQDPARPAAPASPPAAAAKPKKVWTNDDIEPAAPASVREAKPAAVNAGKTSDSNAKLAGELRTKLEKLQGQLTDTEKALHDLRNFEAGEGNGNAGRQLHKGYNMEPVPEQIQKLEAKRLELEEQIDALYDEARKKGILPGQLR